MMMMKCQLQWWRKPEHPEETTYLQQVTEYFHKYNSYLILYTYCVYNAQRQREGGLYGLMSVTWARRQITPNSQVKPYVIRQIETCINSSFSAFLPEIEGGTGDFRYHSSDTVGPSFALHIGLHGPVSRYSGSVLHPAHRPTPTRL